MLNFQIQELMREVGLPQAEAVRALENNGLNVNKAIHAIYRDKINNNALYEHMWGKLEGGGIRQKENERVEKMITEGVYKDYVSDVMLCDIIYIACPLSIYSNY